MSRALFYKVFFTVATTMLLTFDSIGQRFFVQASTELRPPFSVYLADYAAPGSDRLAVNLFLAELDRLDYRVKLRMKIEGVGITITTREGFIPPPIILQGGVPLRLSGSELADYFNPQNLVFQGISRQEFERTGTLPEGVYKFTITALDYNRSVRVSNESNTMAWMILNDPPLINLPMFNTKVRVLEPQNVIFQWTPRHSTSPNAAFSTEYVFKLVEVWPKGRNPFDAINTSAAIFETVTSNTTLLYGPAEPTLVPGRQYAFRVQVRDILGRDLFKNQGFSEVHTFTYGDECKMPLNPSADIMNPRSFRMNWTAVPGQTQFEVRYRKNDPAASWFTEDTFGNNINVFSLEPGTTYEVQVKGLCGSFSGPFTASTVVSMPALIDEGTFSCGALPPDLNLDNTTPLPNLDIGDVISASDFKVKVTQSSGGNGTFSGEGEMELKFLNYIRVRVTFDNITINDEYRMIDGQVRVAGASTPF
ncbi:hypothetical protein FNH22_03860 [Fulvivirga sp. M361]|uniref:fibronectin type III domain-containing protein n=1 Tax=Fulvivirga sp. M361 TaxID=2594266 RepID=UPI00117AD23B|nr:fibronectin type III domain-containing protein [Fulvivirga sp. M361]TRX61201.1 hypothetical protein FNH22_03860 [Fulvivirga sp. M361]